jgi:hypothetical protein
MRVDNVEESGKQAQKNKKFDGKKRVEGSFKKGGSRKSMSPGMGKIGIKWIQWWQCGQYIKGGSKKIIPYYIKYVLIFHYL